MPHGLCSFLTRGNEKRCSSKPDIVLTNNKACQRLSNFRLVVKASPQLSVSEAIKTDSRRSGSVHVEQSRADNRYLERCFSGVMCNKVILFSSMAL